MCCLFSDIAAPDEDIVEPEPEKGSVLQPQLHNVEVQPQLSDDQIKKQFKVGQGCIFCMGSPAQGGGEKK